MKRTSLFVVVLLALVLIFPIASAGSYACPVLYQKYFWSTKNLDWSQIREATAYTLGDGHGACVVDNSGSSTVFVIGRKGITFNASQIPDGEVIQSAVFKGSYYSWGNAISDPPNNANQSLIKFNPANPVSYVLDDMLTFDPDTYSGNIPYGSGSNVNTTIPDVSVFTLSGDYITVGIASDWDYMNVDPAAASGYMPLSGNDGADGVMLYVETGYPKVAVLNKDKTSGSVPLTVSFSDDSTGFSESEPYPEYTITFGDGGSWFGERQYTGEYWFHTYHYAGTYNYSYAVTDGSGTYYSNGTITVTDTDSNFYVEVHGLNTSVIEGANVTIWYNGELQDWEGTSAIGRSYFDVPANRWVNGTVSKPGYQTASYSQYISTWDTWKSVTLYEDDETPGTGDEYWNYIVTFRDANTLETLSNVFIDVYTDSGRTDLYTSENVPYGVWTGMLPNDTTFYFTASAANHLDLEWSYTLSGASVSVYKDMLPVSHGSLQPVLNIFVYDTYGHPLNGASVTVDSDIDDGFHLTNITGYARHFCDNLAYGSSRDYTITAALGGYASESSVVTVSTQQPVVYIFLDKSIYGSVTPTGVYTPVATPVWSGDGGEPGNIKEQLINTIMTQFGVSQLEANILMGIILTLLCAVVVGGGLASYGSGSGAGVGAMIGAVVGFSGSSIIGFFPIWILIVVIVLVFAAWFMFRGRDE